VNKNRKVFERERRRKFSQKDIKNNIEQRDRERKKGEKRTQERRRREQGERLSAF
jgi:hypothetical protein